MEIRKESCGRQAGFSLIEVMIATIILGIGLLAMADAFARGLVIMQRSPLRKIAMEQAESIRQQIRYQQDSEMDIEPGVQAITDSLLLPGGKCLNLGALHFRRTITLNGNGGTITINYDGDGGHPVTLDF